MEYCGTAILPLPLAAQEAWMSINRLQRIAARERFGVNLNGFGWAVRAEA